MARRFRHALENVLDRIRAHTLLPNRELVDLLLEGNERCTRSWPRCISSWRSGSHHASALGSYRCVLGAQPRVAAGPAAPNDPLALAIAELSPAEIAALRNAFEAGDSISVVEAKSAQIDSARFYEVIRAARTWGGIHAFVEAAPGLRLLVSGKGGIFALAKSVGLHGGEILTCDSGPRVSTVPEPIVPPATTPAPMARPAPDAAATNTLRVRLERIDGCSPVLAELLQAKMSLDAAAEHAAVAPHDRMRRTDLAQSLRASDERLPRSRRDSRSAARLDGDVWHRGSSASCGAREGLRQDGKARRARDSMWRWTRNRRRASAGARALGAQRGRSRAGERRPTHRRWQGSRRHDSHRSALEGNGSRRSKSPTTAAHRFRARHRTSARARASPSREGAFARRDAEVLSIPASRPERQRPPFLGAALASTWCATILSNLGGGLEVDSSPGGTIFRLRVPTHASPFFRGFW
jgi:chemotaxis protein histidine kinase CheA